MPHYTRNQPAFCSAPRITRQRAARYETGRKAALGLLLASGWRPTGGEGEHRITFEAAGQLLSGDARRALSDAGYLRQLRNANMYWNERTDHRAATEANEVAGQVAEHVFPVLEGRLG